MDLTQRINAMWAKRGEDYRPRTRHVDSAGRPRYTNRLFLEKSPYLLQHAHNPVDWYPWGSEAFAAARRLDRPVLLSIGYATCHWCHVMEAESFEDEEIARTINDGYIAVKVDREERPDVDAVYMSAVQAITGHGGWPMTVWLTPSQKPFYGGTYFPARDGDRGAPMGFLTILKKIRESYDHKRDIVGRSAAELSRSIAGMLVPAAGGQVPGDEVIGRAVAASKTHFDAHQGGVAGAPKFPSSLPIRLLLRHYHQTGDREGLNMAALTLVKMAEGGINDQVGGGFHRYSTDEAWLVPHFEKMLYDNALLVPAYLDGWQATGNPLFADVVRSTLNYVGREMTAPSGGFYSAGDADSLTPSGNREEGYFFTWTPDELEAALGQPDASIAARAFGVTERGNFEGRNVLHHAMDVDALAVALAMPRSEMDARLQHIKKVLYAYRSRRPAPLVDDKRLVAWNGLMISAFARAGFVLDDAGYVERARNAALFILDAMVDNGRLKRSFREGVAGGSGFLEDYAFFTAALLDLFSVTASVRWLTSAIALDRVLADHFEDAENGGFFMTADDHEALIAREKPFMDGALPSGNAVAAMNLLRFYHLTLDATYRSRAEKTFSAFSGVMETSPLAFGEMLLALADHLHPPRLVTVILGDEGGAAMVDHLRRTFLPGSPVLVATRRRAAQLAAAVAPLQGKRPIDGQTTVHLCRQDACEPPVTDLAALERQLDTRPTTTVDHVHP